MRIRRGHILLTFALAALCIAGCAGRGRVIPKKDMIDLYTDMFLADQWLRDNTQARKTADTTLFFDPIFRRHGYSFNDYEKSLEYYSGRTEDLREVMDSVAKRLKKRAEYYQDLSDRIREVKEENERLRVDYTAVDFSDDSLAWALDSVFWPLRDTVAAADSLAAFDSLAVARDSLAFAKDSLAVAKDSLSAVDSLALAGDSVAGIKPLKADSLSGRRFLQRESGPRLKAERKLQHEKFEKHEAKEL